MTERQITAATYSNSDLEATSFGEAVKGPHAAVDTASTATDVHHALSQSVTAKEDPMLLWAKGAVDGLDISSRYPQLAQDLINAFVQQRKLVLDVTLHNGDHPTSGFLRIDRKTLVLVLGNSHTHLNQYTFRFDSDGNLSNTIIHTGFDAGTEAKRLEAKISTAQQKFATENKPAAKKTLSANIQTLQRALLKSDSIVIQGINEFGMTPANQPQRGWYYFQGNETATPRKAPSEDQTFRVLQKSLEDMST